MTLHELINEFLNHDANDMSDWPVILEVGGDGAVFQASVFTVRIEDDKVVLTSE
jgi:hypothetical protein